MDPQTLLRRPAVRPPGRLVDEPEIEQLLHDARRQPVPAHLVARERLLVDEDDITATAGEMRRGGRATRAHTDDDHVRTLDRTERHLNGTRRLIRDTWGGDPGRKRHAVEATGAPGWPARTRGTPQGAR
jgi:hypothetical protein